MASGTKPKSSSRLLLALPVLLIVAVLVNLGSVKEVVSGKRSLRSILYGMAPPDPNAALADYVKPLNTGAKDAKVVVEAFLIVGEPCHIDTVMQGRALGKIDPARLRIVFRDAGHDKAAAERREKVKLGCEQGFAINGKTQFKVPDPAKPGKQKTVYSAHQKGKEEQGLASLYLLLDQELKAQYKGKGMRMPEAQYNEMMSAEIARIKEGALAEADAERKNKGR